MDNADARGVLVRNNICSANRCFQLVVVPSVARESVTVDHNLIDGFGGTEGEILGENPVRGDPLFVDAGRADFHLRSGSPAINTGNPERAPARDFAGRPRPGKNRPGGCDIGAFQF